MAFRKLNLINTSNHAKLINHPILKGKLPVNAYADFLVPFDKKILTGSQNKNDEIKRKLVLLFSSFEKLFFSLTMSKLILLSA